MEQIRAKMNKLRRKHRVRAVVNGTPERPRVSVVISNRHVSAQVIDDSTGRTLASASTVGQKVNGTMTEKAVWAGKTLAKAATKAKVKTVVLDRNGRRYHGRLAAFAEAARAEGLEF